MRSFPQAAPALARRSLSANPGPAHGRPVAWIACGEDCSPPASCFTLSPHLLNETIKTLAHPASPSRSPSPLQWNLIFLRRLARLRSHRWSVHGDYLSAAEKAQDAAQLFHALRDPAGEQRARSSVPMPPGHRKLCRCYSVAHALLAGNAEFAWIQSQAQALDAYCNPAPGPMPKTIPGSCAQRTWPMIATTRSLS